MEVTQRQSYCIWAATTGYTKYTERHTQNTAGVAQAAGDAQEVTACAAIGLGTEEALRGTEEALENAKTTLRVGAVGDLDLAS